APHPIDPRIRGTEFSECKGSYGAENSLLKAALNRLPRLRWEKAWESAETPWHTGCRNIKSDGDGCFDGGC
ncbi:hypothetical protein MKW98_005722, partial [Papaver atlanticum]